jgi:outer membrane receptor protein involved in Fe transport
LSTNFLANVASFNELSVVGFSCVGLWGLQCGEPEPRFKSNLRVTWADEENDISLSLRWRHLSGVQFEQNLDPNFVNSPTLKIPEFDYLDVSGTFSLTESIELRWGVRNVLGKKPPVTDNNSAPAASINGNTFPNTYDALGRVIFVGGTAKL